MPALPKAIIHTPTQKEAVRFLDFAKEYGYLFPSYERCGDTYWNEHEEDTCYDTENTDICYCSRDWYEDNQEESWWPEDPQFQFCTVDEFIAYVTGSEPAEETNLTGLMDLLM